MKAIPALLTNSSDELKQQITNLAPYFSYYQIDITDGIFVPSKTLSIEEVGKAIADLEAEMVQKMTFDFDLMVTDVSGSIESLITLQETIHIQNVFIHVSALKQQPLPICREFAIGIAIDPSDDINDLEKHYNINSIPAIQIMTVIPGFQGSSFKEEELNKIDWLRQHGYRNNIFIDGGVNDKTIPLILSRQKKPNYAGIGSFLSKASNIKERVEYLQNMLR